MDVGFCRMLFFLKITIETRHLLVLVSHQPPACAREGDGRGLQLCSPLGSQGQEGMSLQQAPARLRGVSPPEGCRSSTSRASWA